jgi:hypothetical protein
MRTRAAGTGVAIVVAYLAAVLVTGALRHDGARPLFDGFAPPPSYEFVDPPPFFAAGNVRPGAVARSIEVRSTGSAGAGVGTPDGQFVIDLAPGAVAPRAGATSVAVRIMPVAPKHLAAVPTGSRANGNVYRLDMTYEPTGEPVTGFAKPGTMLIETPELANALLHSSDGGPWNAIPARTVAPNGLSMSAELRAPGDYVATTTLPELAAAPAASNGSHTSAIILGVVVALVALAFFGIAFVVRRRDSAAPNA